VFSRRWGKKRNKSDKMYATLAFFLWSDSQIVETFGLGQRLVQRSGGEGDTLRKAVDCRIGKKEPKIINVGWKYKMSERCHEALTPAAGVKETRR